MVALTAAYVAHVLSAAFWTGATLYVAYAVLPAARGGRLRAAGFVEQVHRLLLVTRWTGIVLPATGAYMIWRLYTPLELLTTTTRGWVVLVMIGLWGALNTVLELGVLRMRRAVDDPGFGQYMSEGFPAERLSGDVTGVALADLGRPYLLVGAALATLLLVDAALLAVGVPV